MTTLITIGSIVLLTIITILALMWRRVVDTNMVHIVQYAKKTLSYGTKSANGNVYYKIPTSIPKFGVTVVEYPVSNFDLVLPNYEAYDMDRVPFLVDVVSFFRIEDTNKVAQRVKNMEELKKQLLQIVQGAVRKILAGDDIDTIMLERSKFGEAFTSEVSEQLKEWGVVTVKSMELMDIRDTHDSKSVENIMAKKQSEIEMTSRSVVAENKKKADVAEIEAKRETDIQKEQAEQAIGERKALKTKAVGIADEIASQEIKDQQVTTAEKDMSVLKVREVRAAEIERDKQIVVAEQDKRTTIIVAEGELEKVKRDSEGVVVDGEAKADAERLILLAPVEAQITLAKEIGSNAQYMEYLLGVEAIAAHRNIGVEQAQALTESDLKIIANAGSVESGLSNLTEIFSAKGGTSGAAALEALAQSDIGKNLLDKFISNKETVEEKQTSKKTGSPAPKK